MSCKLSAIYARPVIHALERYAPAPSRLATLVEESVLRLLDSGSIIGHLDAPFSLNAKDSKPIPLPSVDVPPAIEETISSIRKNGFGREASNLFREFGAIFFSLVATAEQRRLVDMWSDDGSLGAFCMTDCGGSNLGTWNSSWNAKLDPIELTLNKRWVMNADRAKFAIAILRGPTPFAPVTALIPPDAYQTAEKKSCGVPFFDGLLPLFDIKGTWQANDSWHLAGGSPIAPKIFLTLVRPLLIQAQIAHLSWCVQHGVIVLTKDGEAILDYLSTVACSLGRAKGYSRGREDATLALKLGTNEFWVHLVKTGRVNSASHERDFLAFSKMEGSSYQCMTELMQRQRRVSCVDA